MKPRWICACWSVLLASSTISVALAQDDGASGVIAGGDAWAQLRYRLESVEVEGPLRSALASTLRTRVGFETNSQRTFGMLLEAEDVHALGDDRFNSTTNGRTDYATVADPDATEINQAFVTARGAGWKVNAGRQIVSFDAERFIGSVDFRQNQQTYDALLAQASLPAGTQLTYSYLWQVNRFLGDDHPSGKLDLRTHALNFAWPRLNGDRFVAYAYLLELDEDSLRGASTQTYGASYDGGVDMGVRKLLYRAEYAYQGDYADAPSAASVWYGNLEAGLRFKTQWVVTAGIELLSGNGNVAFQTPLATLHKFNGFADVFAAATPVEGLQDRYLRVYLPVLGTRFTVTAHTYHDDRGDRDYGRELDAEINWRIDKHWLLGLKYADYDADEFAVDTRKGWLWVQADF